MLYLLYAIIALSVFLLYVMPDSYKSNLFLRFPNSLLNYFILFIILGSATFNNDWLAYDRLFSGIDPSYDLLYVFGFKIFNFFGFTFTDFYAFNQSVIYIAFIFLITRFTSKYILIVVLSILVLAGPNLSILLRFYTAFGFFLVSAYYIIVKKKKVTGYFFLGLAFISHFGVIILAIFFLIYKLINIQKSFRIVFTVAFLIYVFQNLLFAGLLATGLGSFVIYIEDQSSFIGGIFVSLPYIPWVVVIFRRNQYLLKNNIDLINDQKYSFLYKLTMFSFFFFIIAIFLQIVLNRYVEPFIIIWSLYLCYSIRFSKTNINKYLLIFKILILLILSIYLKYFLPITIIGSSEWLLHYLEILNSNRYKIFNIL